MASALRPSPGSNSPATSTGRPTPSIWSVSVSPGALPRSSAVGRER